MDEPAPRPGDRLSAIDLDERGLAAATPEIEQERQVAIYDLLEANRFGLPRPPDREVPDGPYRLVLALRDGRLVLDIRAAENDAPAAEARLSLAPFRQVVKDYFHICESYSDAVRSLPPARIEIIDAGRREIHNEGSRLLLERLAGIVDTDMNTARRLFTLICVLHAED